MQWARAATWSAAFTFFFFFQLGNNCFTVLCWFLPYINMTQPQVSICPYIPPVLNTPHISLLISPLAVVTRALGWAQFTVLHSKFPPAIYFTHGKCICFPGGSDGKEYACNARDPSSIPGSGRFPGEKNGNTPVFWPGESHGQRNLVGYSPWGCKESDTSEQISLSLFSLFKVYVPMLFSQFVLPFPSPNPQVCSLCLCHHYAASTFMCLESSHHTIRSPNHHEKLQGKESRPWLRVSTKYQPQDWAIWIFQPSQASRWL